MRDVIVIGGGPAGATAANLLARSGRDVVMLERERFPRFHIGESLLPRSVPILQRLGVDLGGPAFLYKGGAEFVNEETGTRAHYPFLDALPTDLNPDHAFQVDRATFDHALLRAAEDAGASVRQGETVRHVDVLPDRVVARTETGETVARYCIDATGQDAFFARRDRTTEPYRSFGRAAVFTHFEGLSDAAVAALGPAGNIKVLMIDDGWAWLIPLAGRRLSIGVVTRKSGTTPALLGAFLESSGLARSMTQSATRLGTHVIRNFSYRNTRCYEPRRACIGDAACFLDPVFSSGVALAMMGAEAVVAALVPALESGNEGAADLMAPVQAHLDHAYACVSALVYAFYNTQMIQNLFFAEKPVPELPVGAHQHPRR